jgi:iron complex outermembrane receptor protein
MMKPTTLLVSSLVVGLPFYQTVAGAQEAPRVESEQKSSSKETQAPASAEGSTAAHGALEEVVVTAQHRAESLQRSSLSITAVDSAQIASSNLTQAEGLSRLVPNLQVGQFTYSRVYLRGIGDNTANALSQAAVAVNVDGVNVARSSQIGGNFYDVARIEVLKGPQGTLYGRNAAAGVINIITKAPGPDLEGELGATVGNYDLRRVQGALNVPLKDNLAVRAAFNVVDRDGYLADGYDDDEQQSGRIRLAWEPTDDLKIGFKMDYTHVGGMGQSSVVYPTPPGQDPWMAASGPVVRSYQIAANAPPVPADGFVDNEYASASAQLDADLGFAQLTVLPAYRWQETAFYTSPAGTLNFAEQDRVHQESIEARLARNTDTLKLVAGAYYFKETTDFNQQVYQGVRLGATTGLSNIYTPYHAPTEAIAGFADANVSLTSRVRLLGGIRYTTEKRGLYGTSTTFATIPTVPLCPAGVTTPGPAFRYCFVTDPDNSVSNDAVTWRGGVEVDVAQDSMAYLTVNRGFKSGGVYSGPAPDNAYDPEFLTSFDVGIRNRFLDNTLQLNLGAFYWLYEDYQFTFVNFTTNGTQSLVTTNAGKARLYGANADIILTPTSADTLSATVEYLSTEFTEFSYTTPIPVDGQRSCKPQGVAGSVTLPNGGSTPLFGFDCSGVQLARAPKWSIQAAWSHSFFLPQGAKIVAGIDGQYNSAYKLDVTAVDFLTQKSFTVANAELGYHSAEEHWSVTAWVKNISDRAVYNDARRYGVSSFSGADIRPPRTFGVRLNYHFF